MGFRIRKTANNRSFTVCMALLMGGFLWAAACGADAPEAPLQAPENAKASESAASPPLLPDVLDLETAQRIALDKNPSLQAAAEMVAQAGEKVKQARSLYFPQIQATYSASRTWLPDTDQYGEDTRNVRRVRRGETVDQQADDDLPASTLALLGQTMGGAFDLADDIQRLMGEDVDGLSIFDSDTLESYSLSIQAGFLLFDGFSREFTNAMARFGRKEGEAGRREAQRLLLSAISQAYYGVQLARENIDVAKASEDFNQLLLDEAKARREKGKGPTSDVLNFEIAVRAARAARLTAEREHHAARIGLAVLMGLPQAELPEQVRIADLAAESPEELEQPDTETAIQAALRYRPDLAQREYGVKRAQAGVKQRRSGYAPEVSVFVSRDGQSYSDTRFDGDEWTTTVGVGVTYDIFTGGRKRSQVAEAKHAQRQAELEQTSAEIEAISQVRLALNNLRTAQDQLVLQRTTEEYVERNRDLVKKGFQAGKAPLALLNQAQTELVRAQGQLVLAQVTLRQAWFELRTATGESLAPFEDEEP